MDELKDVCICTPHYWFGQDVHTEIQQLVRTASIIK